MTSSWVSVLLGAGLGGGYGVAAYAMSRLALRYRRQRFMTLLVGGMLLRMVGMLAAVGGVLALVTVRPAAFMLPLVLFLFVGLAFEVRALCRRA